MNKSWILAGTALTGLLMASGAMAQSTATQEVEQVTEVVVRGAKTVGQLKRESGVKQKSTVDQATISQGSAGQTIAETLNVIPGFNFTNNDAFGSSGGNIVMRGLDNSRISLTFDGVQLNDSGNYAIYTNQQMEPELICSASVQTGATDADSMTASATGGTINYSTCKPEDTMGGVVKLSGGSDNFKNLFVRFDTGKFGPFGTKLFLAATNQSYDTWTREPVLSPNLNAELKKYQYNARLYQDIGDDGSFMSLAAQWNVNRNYSMFGPSKPQINCEGTNVAPNCGYDYNSIEGFNINPSDTGSIRGQSKWVLSDKLTLTVDPTFQYVLATGGSVTRLSEQDARLCGTASLTAACGLDLNGDGDKLDTNTSNTATTNQAPRVYQANITNTYRYSLNTSAIYKFTDTQTLRLGLSFDRANHRQTGEMVKLDANNSPIDPFGGKKKEELRIKTLDGSHMRRRDRQSYANVDVVSLEYRGRFFDEKLFVSAALRHQKMERELNQYCYSPIYGTGSSTPYCTTQKVENSVTLADGAKVVTLEGASTTAVYFAPFQRTVSFSKTMPNIGATWTFENNSQIFASYSESMSSPRTDSYYAVVLDNSVDGLNKSNFATTTNQALYKANSMVVANPKPETSQTLELGYRFRKPTFNATATVFTAEDKDRIVSSYDFETATFFDRNIGNVKRSGFEASAAYTPVETLVLNAGLTYTDTEVQSDLAFGKSTTGVVRLLPTAGKQLVEMPKWMWTVGLDYQITSALAMNLSGKYVGDRFTTDINDDVAPHYFVWNGSLRYDLPFLKEGTYVQLNAINLFDQKYLGSFSSQNNALPYVDAFGTKSGTFPFMNVGAPQTFVLSLRAKF
ncbi:TonB-dependent receptor [Asticcacaulis sp. YBE204]|uniref:TonB-dependent receptor n=1 Tax=Asticcacaulis sp. YBE204 TaxID=1282363 RepID=UPI00138AFCA5|nr:TonB-dependent receptor [Asticcacaulis sp. YBE204]